MLAHEISTPVLELSFRKLPSGMPVLVRVLLILSITSVWLSNDAIGQQSNSGKLVWKIAHAYAGSDGSTANPTIHIDGLYLTYQTEKSGGGWIQGIQLSGTGGTYNFKDSTRTYAIEPGTYTVYLLSMIVGSGSIGATVRYQQYERP